MSDTLVRNHVKRKPVDSATTEFTVLVDPATGNVTGRSPRSAPGHTGAHGFFCGLSVMPAGDSTRVKHVPNLVEE